MWRAVLVALLRIGPRGIERLEDELGVRDVHLREGLSSLLDQLEIDRDLAAAFGC